MHIRKLPRFSAPARLLQIVMLQDEAEAGRSAKYFEGLCAQHGSRLDVKAKYLTCRLGALDFAWERHTEFATYSFIAHARTEPLFSLDSFSQVPGWLADLPGRMIRGTLVELIDASSPPPSDRLLAENFSADDLVACDVAEGRARIWSDFRLHQGGFGRLLVADRGLVGGEATQLVQRLQELGNYRKIALLGLPVAQRLTPEVSRLEERLAALTSKVAQEEADDDALLDELSFLSAELARIMAETRYRMSASRAYAALCADRVTRLQEQRVPGYQTLTDFTERRLLPAMRTCEAFSHRLDDLSQRAAWTSSLLRTRVDTALARQNRDLLASMNRRTDLQLRLQQTVEGLSVVAISYYVVGLLAYLGKPLRILVPTANPELVTALLVPPVLFGVWLMLRRIRRRLH